MPRIRSKIERLPPWPTLHPSTNFHGIRFSRFCAILLQVRQKNTALENHNLLAWGDNIKKGNMNSAHHAKATATGCVTGTWRDDSKFFREFGEINSSIFTTHPEAWKKKRRVKQFLFITAIHQLNRARLNNYTEIKASSNSTSLGALIFSRHKELQPSLQQIETFHDGSKHTLRIKRDLSLTEIIVLTTWPHIRNIKERQENTPCCEHCLNLCFITSPFCP